MSRKMNTKVFGIMGIKSMLSNWNADFNGEPRTLADGQVIGSDVATKYPIKKMWQESGENVFFLKSYKIENGDVRPNSLEERYENLFNASVPKKLSKKDMNNADIKMSTQKEVLDNLFSAVDIKNFGCTFASEGFNIGITGAVQFTHGYNKYEDHETETLTILSPFRNSKNKVDKESGEEVEDKSSTLGSKVVSNEAHYIYGFSVNPYAYDNFVDMWVTDGYTEEDYNKLKKGILIGATAYNSASKAGCENELAIFIETDNETYLPNLSHYVSFEKGGSKDKLILNFGDMVENLGDRIKSCEIYYNPLSTDLIGEIKGAKLYNIFTQQEI